jgi:hypothetical protein
LGRQGTSRNTRAPPPAERGFLRASVSGETEAGLGVMETFLIIIIIIIIIVVIIIIIIIKLRGFSSAIELYRPSDCLLSAELVPTFAVRGCHIVSCHGTITWKAVN